MLHLSFAQRAYIILTMLFIGVYFLCAHFYIEEKRETLIQKKYLDLFMTGSYVERELDKNQFNAKVRETKLMDVSQDEKINIFNKLYQPFIEHISSQFPRYGFGLYFPAEDKEIAVALKFSPELLKNSNASQVLEIDEKQKSYGMARDNFNDFWEGKTTLNVSYPIALNEEIMGHIWVSSSKDDIEKEMIRLLSRIKMVLVGVWFLCVITLNCLTRKLQNVMVAVAANIRNDDYDLTLFDSFPRLKPLFDTLIELKESLKLEYMEREILNGKMAKISKLTLISEMAASVAHEVRNPMTVINGYIQFMMQRATTKDRVKYELIITEINRINSLITEFLSLAKDKIVKKDKQNVNEMIKHIYPLINTEALRYSTEIILDLDAKVPLVLLDEKEFIQLILNLCKNAIDAMKGEKGILLIQTHKVQNGVEIIIVDNGSGIPEQDLERVFDPFYTTKDDGTGLGLAVCRSIVLRHGGKIVATSALGEGTTFRVSFPEGKL